MLRNFIVGVVYSCSWWVVMSGHYSLLEDDWLITNTIDDTRPPKVW